MALQGLPCIWLACTNLDRGEADETPSLNMVFGQGCGKTKQAWSTQGSKVYLWATYRDSIVGLLLQHLMCQVCCSPLALQCKLWSFCELVGSSGLWGNQFALSKTVCLLFWNVLCSAQEFWDCPELLSQECKQ